MEKLQFFQETGHKQTLRQVDHTNEQNCVHLHGPLHLRNSHIKVLSFVQMAIDAIQQYYPSTF